MQVILDSSFARPGSAPIWGGKQGEFRDWTKQFPARSVQTQPAFLALTEPSFLLSCRFFALLMTEGLAKAFGGLAGHLFAQGAGAPTRQGTQGRPNPFLIGRGALLVEGSSSHLHPLRGSDWLLIATHVTESVAGEIQGRCHRAALKWNGSTQVVPYIDFAVAKLVLTESNS